MPLVVQEKVRNSLRGRKDSFCSSPFVKAGFVHLLQRAAVSMQIRIVDSEQLSRRLAIRIKRTAPSPTTELALERFREPTAQRDDLLLLLNNYKVSRKVLKRDISEQVVIGKIMTESVKLLEMQKCSLQEESRLLQNANKMFPRSYVEQKTVVGKSVSELVKALLCVLFGEYCASVELSRNYTSKTYQNWSISAHSCV